MDRERERASDRKFDRRKVLRLGGSAAAIGAVELLLRPDPAGAATAALQFGAENDAGTATTGLTSASGGDTLHLTNTANAAALRVRSGGTAVIAGGAGGGVVGITSGSAPGVLGQAAVGTGPAVRAEIADAAATAATLEAAQSGKGSGVVAHVDNAASEARAVEAHTKGLGAAVLASIENAGSKAAALSAQTTGPGVGINAASALGIGGKFSGRTAQIQLVPSTAPIHPPTGVAGELFVDKANRLWFCKGGAVWHQLA